ncbi:MAG: ATP-binding SpoIIE family protein phosphatase [Caldilineaceae bacterium]
MLNQQDFYPVADQSQVAKTRRQIGELASQLGFDEVTREKVAIVVTELATNLLKHAGGGELVVRQLTAAEQMGLEILALDQGPGMTNMAQCLRDGYSTTGSLGQGLGAIQRQSTSFDFYSAPGKGTALLVQMWTRAPQGDSKSSLFSHGAICRPKPGQVVSGDGWSLHTNANHCTLLVSDGLGHGPEAAAATQQAISTFLASPNRTAMAQMETIHAALHSTRGAAVAVAQVAGEIVHFVGVGNISGQVWDNASTRHLLSQHGITGHQARKIQDFTQKWARGALLILHSDGLGTRWTLDAYPGLSHHHPGLIAGVLYRDFVRGNDDVTVVVVKDMQKILPMQEQ